MNTPFSLNIKRGTIIPPKDGWQAHTWYLADIACNSTNVIHRSFFYSGFLTGINYKTPGGYNGAVCINYADNDPQSIEKLYYLKIIKRLFTTHELKEMESENEN